MSSRSRSLCHDARSLFVGGVVAVGLILDLGRAFPVHAQQTAPLVKGSNPQDKRPAAPTARLRDQQLKTRKAMAAYEIARLTRELAEIAVEEYAEGIYAQDLASLEGELKLAEADLTRAEDRLDWARRMFDKGYVSMAMKVSEELNAKKAQFALEQAQAKKKVLIEYTRAKTTKELESEARKARADELAKKVIWKREEVNEAELEHQLERP